MQLRIEVLAPILLLMTTAKTTRLLPRGTLNKEYAYIPESPAISVNPKPRTLSLKWEFPKIRDPNIAP